MTTELNKRRRGAGRLVRGKGFTLVELMVVVAIVALLATIAYPAFRDQTLRAGRAEGRTALMELASRQEQYILDNRSYTTDLGLLGMNGATENGKYTVSVTAASASAFTARATPQGGQAEDTDCLALTINSAGTRSATGPDGADCWN